MRLSSWTNPRRDDKEQIGIPGHNVVPSQELFATGRGTPGHNVIPLWNSSLQGVEYLDRMFCHPRNSSLQGEEHLDPVLNKADRSFKAE
jgi:hypothetical protein